MDKKTILSITLIRSPAGRKPAARATVKGLGLTRMHQTVEREATVQLLGMVNAIQDMLRVEEKRGV